MKKVLKYKPTENMKTTFQSPSFLLFAIMLVATSFSTFAGHNDTNEIEQEKLTRAIEEMEVQFVNNEKQAAAFSSGKVYKIINGKEEVVLSEEVLSEKEISLELQSLLRKSDFLLEANNTFYYTL